MTAQTQLSTFSFESKPIRTLAINNEPWFVAKDLCNALNISPAKMYRERAQGVRFLKGSAKSWFIWLTNYRLRKQYEKITINCFDINIIRCDG